MVDISAIYDEALREEYGFEIPQLDSLIESTVWMLEDLDVDLDDYATVNLAVQSLATAYKLGWDEGLDSAFN